MMARDAADPKRRARGRPSARRCESRPSAAHATTPVDATSIRGQREPAALARPGYPRTTLPTSPVHAFAHPLLTIIVDDATRAREMPARHEDGGATLCWS
jgi:hypothetical protein